MSENDARAAAEQEVLSLVVKSSETLRTFLKGESLSGAYSDDFMVKQAISALEAASSVLRALSPGHAATKSDD